jgi:hypothetical protein
MEAAILRNVNFSEPHLGIRAARVIGSDVTLTLRASVTHSKRAITANEPFWQDFQASLRSTDKKSEICLKPLQIRVQFRVCKGAGVPVIAWKCLGMGICVIGLVLKIENSCLNFRCVRCY